MKVKDDEHLHFIVDCCGRAKTADSFHRALFYVLGLSGNCKNHIEELYDFKSHCIKSDTRGKDWITGADMRLIRLAFNLFTGLAPTAAVKEDIEEELFFYTPQQIFSYLDAELMEYCFEAIRVLRE